ncbi:Uncharacterized protein YR821_2840 [Yersinia ruckeri]|uniref:Uncharacterized protein n=1 Tax=Yersinia ruckeri TaxID=29486 RepID=A0A0A8VJY9_YERRU|nr:hypothetical protein yruck0001_4520 [Yersinia ruckeri ATCC 29473]QTD77757.1 Uncharacterized protein YR821_2840 [Yersinia ruckeri]CEK28678.1 hypothetical protein CSF007_14770 [Yersinia ruckeri]
MAIIEHDCGKSRQLSRKLTRLILPGSQIGSDMARLFTVIFAAAK